jgi:hypothetical protein
LVAAIVGSKQVREDAKLTELETGGWDSVDV